MKGYMFLYENLQDHRGFKYDEMRTYNEADFGYFPEGGPVHYFYHDNVFGGQNTFDLYKIHRYRIVEVEVSGTYRDIDDYAVTNEISLIRELSDKEKWELLSSIFNKPNGQSFFMYKCQTGDIESIKKLIQYGADLHKLNDRGENALFYAIDGNYQYDNMPIISFLIENGIDIHATNIFGDTPLHRAVFLGELNAVQYLLDHGAKKDINMEIRVNKHTPLYLACYNNCMGFDREKQREMVNLLLDNGANIPNPNIVRFMFSTPSKAPAARIKI